MTDSLAKYRQQQKILKNKQWHQLKTTDLPKFVQQITPKEFLESPNPFKEMENKLPKVKKYLQTVHDYSGFKRDYLIMPDGQIVEMDPNLFFRNKKFLSQIDMYTARMRNNEQLLKLGWIITNFDPDSDVLKVFVWKNNIRFLSFPFRVFLRLAEKLRRKMIQVQSVEAYSMGSPIGETRIMSPFEIQSEYMKKNTPYIRHDVLL